MSQTDKSNTWNTKGKESFVGLLLFFFFNFSGISLLSSTQARHTLEHVLQNILEDKLSTSKCGVLSLPRPLSLLLSSLLPTNPPVHTHLHLCLLPRMTTLLWKFLRKFLQIQFSFTKVQFKETAPRNGQDYHDALGATRNLETHICRIPCRQPCSLPSSLQDWRYSIGIKTLEPRWKGPYTILLMTPTALKVDGIPAWIHTSNVKAAPGRDHEETSEPRWKLHRTQNPLKLRLSRLWHFCFACP